MMSSKLPQFKGLMPPTFTAFKENGEVNYDVIVPYAKLLKSKGISAVLVNGTSGEAMSMTVDERKKVTEIWSKVCKELDMLLMVQTAGCPNADTIELTKHAAALNVDGILCLPDLYFKPRTIQKAVENLKYISTFCPNIPIYYYHIPIFSGIDLPMAAFMELARKEIPTFTGIKFSTGDVEQGLPCLKFGQVFLGANTIWCGGLALGFDCAIKTSLNIKPEIAAKITELMKLGKVEEAREQQHVLNGFIETWLKNGNGEIIASLKKAFNEEFKDINLGKTRKPL